MRERNEWLQGQRNRRHLRGLCIFGLLVLTTILAGGPANTALALASGAGATDVSGKAPPATRGFPSVIILEPDSLDNLTVPTDPVVMDQVRQEFVPRVLVARSGQPVDFHNGEDLLHNVHVLNLHEDSTVINVAMPRLGMTYRVTLPHTGTYAVVCDVHPEMEAYIIVTASPYAMVADNDGGFHLADIPPGSYRLHIWNVDESLQSQQAVNIDRRADVTVIGKH